MIAIVKTEPDGEEFIKYFAQGGPLFISAGTMQEAMIVAIGIRGSASEIEDLIAEWDIAVIPVDAHLARLGAEAFRRFGKGQGHPASLNFGDCFAYALAKARDLPLLFKGADFAQTDIRDARVALA